MALDDVAKERDSDGSKDGEGTKRGRSEGGSNQKTPRSGTEGGPHQAKKSGRA